ncbi:MAG: RNA pseudouridine synthase [Clostridiales bacterium]|nr:RNA pseudouridine synthase [Clostridiales bacterium]
MIEILEQTPQMVLCVKPVGVRAQGEAEADLPALLKWQLGCEIYPVHRLDQAVGGVMVFAKTAPAAAKLSQAIAGGELQKEYLAVLERSPEQTEGELSDLLFHDRTKNKTYVVSRQRKGVKEAKLAYRVLDVQNGLCLVRIRLYTGRTHQIRVQFASRGMPLVGDGKYGSRKNAASPALWSYALTLPMGGAIARIRALPEAAGVWAAFEQALRMLT